MRILPILAATSAIAAAVALATPKWKPIFNGKTFEPEWYIAGDKTFWKIQDSAIVGSTTTQVTPYTMVFTNKKDYDQFTLKYSYRLKAGCSGFFFRSKEVSTTERVAGMQVEAKYENNMNREVGSLYCHTCGEWRVQHSDAYSRKIAKPVDQFQSVVLTVKKPYIYVNVNGFQAVGETDQAELTSGAKPPWEYTNTNIIKDIGNFGLQIHGGQRPMDVAFKDIAILEGCTDAASPGMDKAAFVSGLPKQPAVYQSNAELCGTVGTAEEIRARLLTHFGPVTREGKTVSLSISHPGAHTLAIVSLTGKVVFEGSAPGAHEYRLSSIPKAGVYLAKLTVDGKVASKKILVP